MTKEPRPGIGEKCDVGYNDYQFAYDVMVNNFSLSEKEFTHYKAKIAGYKNPEDVIADNKKICERGLFCAEGLCREGKVGDVCEIDYDCRAGFKCSFGKCWMGRIGDSCEDQDGCLDSSCVNNICKIGDVGDKCNKNLDCATNNCKINLEILEKDEKIIGECVTPSKGYSLPGGRCARDIWDNDVWMCPEGSPCCSNCMNNVCYAGREGDPCEKDHRDCGVMGWGLLCYQGKCQLGYPGDPCDTIEDCSPPSIACIKGKCSGGFKGDACSKNEDCFTDFSESYRAIVETNNLLECNNGVCN